MTDHPNTWREHWKIFLKIGLLSFGGPAAQISVMHRVLVEETRWLSEKLYLNALSFCMLLPGPEAMQLATYAGWRLRGVWGGLFAGLLFVMPGAMVMLGLSIVYVTWGEDPLIATLFLGVKATVLIVVLEALLRISKRALKRRLEWGIAGTAFMALFFLDLPYPLIVVAAAVTGFLTGGKAEPANRKPVATIEWYSTVQVLISGVVLWLGPLIILDQMFDIGILSAIGAFFAKLAVVTFGGAYAVLAYMAQDVVQHHGWLQPGEMMDGLGLAETTPGPLILVTQFVGFLAAARDGGLGYGIAGAVVTLWATFVPCFAGGPYIEWIAAQRRLSSALSAITAAVVGVILNLSIWFGLHVLFDDVQRHALGMIHLWAPVPDTLNPLVAGLTLLSVILLLRLHLGIGWVLGISAGLGWAITQAL